MFKNRKSLLRFFVPFTVGLIIYPLVALAGNVTFTADTTAAFTVGNCTIRAASTANSADINGNTLTIVQTTGDEFTVNCPSTIQLTSNPTVGELCESDSTRTYRQTSGVSSLTTQFTAASVSTACGAGGGGTGGGGSGGGGGGGGGGSSGSGTGIGTGTTEPPPEDTGLGEGGAIECLADSSLLPTISDTYSDVGSHWGLDYMRRAVHRMIMVGYSDDTMRPNDNTNRAEASKMVAVAFDVVIPDSVSSSAFTDVEVDQWYARYVETLYQLGKVSGRSPGMFVPGSYINRAEALALILRVQGIEPSPDYVAPQGTKAFTDVAASQWFYRDVMFASARGIVTGYSDGSFKPGANVTRAEFLAMLFKSMDSTGEPPCY